VLRIAANLVVRQLGFVAISDDDYARIVIGQQFAHAPSWDPSGTSWLPFPFWLTGTVMMACGLSLHVAHTLAWVTSLSCVALVYLAAFWCGQAPRWAGIVACAFALFPHAVWLDLATVPEGYAAVLAVLALASCNRPDVGARVLGIVCVTAATLARYELWPVAAVVAIAQYCPRPSNVVRGAAFSFGALLGPASWLLHGAMNHGDALFFVARVANYRSGVGQAPDGWFDVVLNYPTALVGKAPELVACSALTAATVALTRARPAGRVPLPGRGLTYVVLGAASVFLFLILGDANNGAPTHHPERVLQLCWLALLLVQGTLLSHVHVRSARGLRALTLGFLAVIGLGLCRTNTQGFVNRSTEIAVGQALASRLTDHQRLFIETRGYGYIAVAAATAQPWNVVGFNPDDPRQPPTLWTTPAELPSFFARERVRWAIVPPERQTGLGQTGTPVSSTALGVLLDVQ
jgi:hypothetical protein